MSELTRFESEKLATYTGGISNFAQEIISAIPLALAAPILSYQKTKEQAKLLEIAIEAKRRERSEILKTMQILAKYGQLTDELSRQLMIAYNSQPY